MAKLTLTDLASLTNETSAITTINNNNDAIEAAIEKTLSRDGTSPNSLSAQLDMNTNKIINLAPGTTTGNALEYSQLQSKVDDITTIYNNAVTAKNQAVAAQSAAELAAANANAAESEAEDILADVQALFDSYNNQYLGTFASPPTVDNDGHALTVGDLYYDSILLSFRVWDGSTWQDVASMTPISHNEVSNKIYISPVIRTSFLPETTDGVALGSTSKMFSDLFLASGAVINFNNGDVTVTHSSDQLTIGGLGAYTIGSSGGLQVNQDIVTTSGAIYALGGSIPTSSSVAGVYFGKESANNNRAIQIVTPTSGSAYIDFAPTSVDFDGRILVDTVNHIMAFSVNGAEEVRISSTATYPSTSDGNALGTTANMWSDLFLASGAVINFNNSDVTLTHSTDALTLAGLNTLSLPTSTNLNWGGNTASITGFASTGSFTYSADPGNAVASSAHNFAVDNATKVIINASSQMTPGANDGTALGSSTVMWSDLFLASGAVINFNNSNVTLTHSTGALTLSGSLTATSTITTNSQFILDSGVADGADVQYKSSGFTSWFNDNSSGAYRWFQPGQTYMTLTTTKLDAAVDIQTSTPGTASASCITLGGNKTLLGGFSATSFSDGTVSSGTLTPSAGSGNFHHYTNNGAHTLAPPSTVCTMIVECTNGASAGAITTSSFTKVTGDTLTTTNGNKFIFFITKTNSYSHFHVQALQ